MRPVVSMPWSEHTMSRASSPSPSASRVSQHVLPRSGRRRRWRSRCAGEPRAARWPVKSGSDSHSTARAGRRAVSTSSQNRSVMAASPALPCSMASWSPAGTGDQTGREGAGPMVDPAVTVGVLEVGGARRHVGHHDGAAVRRQPLGQGRAAARCRRWRGASARGTRAWPPRDRPARRLRRAPWCCRAGRGRPAEQPVAMQAEVTRVTEGKTPASVGEVGRGLGEGGQGGSSGGRDEITSQAIADDEHGASHGRSLPLTRLSALT